MACWSFRELEAAAARCDPLGAAAIAREAEETDLSEVAVRERLAATLDAMETSVAEGLAADRRSRSGLTGQDASRLTCATGRIAGPAFSGALATPTGRALGSHARG